MKTKGHTNDKSSVILRICSRAVPKRLLYQMALSQLDETDKELLLLRYANEVPVSVISKMYGISRFAVYRKTLQATKNLKSKLGKEDFS